MQFARGQVFLDTKISQEYYTIGEHFFVFLCHQLTFHEKNVLNKKMCKSFPSCKQSLKFGCLNYPMKKTNDLFPPEPLPHIKWSIPSVLISFHLNPLPPHQMIYPFCIDLFPPEPPSPTSNDPSLISFHLNPLPHIKWSILLCGSCLCFLSAAAAATTRTLALLCDWCVKH